VTYPRANSDIALQLLEQFKGLIDGIVYKMGVRYRLSTEDREDIKAAIIAKIGTIKWRSVLKKRNGQCLNNYCISVIQNSAIKEVRRIKAFGLSGLSKGPAIAAFPHEDDNLQPERGMDGLPDHLAAVQIVQLTSQVLNSEEQSVISLLYGFDGGPSRTEPQVAKALKMPRTKVADLFAQAMAKLRSVV
jgi:DNA-directed RNA polymerase specialized sigma subunit